ncbi:MAG TPA: hypothetical protein VE760_09005 [Acidimicrobiales bacterium]|nr:hypothetical protein [Acidimicrobiales bacterium]
MTALGLQSLVPALVAADFIGPAAGGGGASRKSALEDADRLCRAGKVNAKAAPFGIDHCGTRASF